MVALGSWAAVSGANDPGTPGSPVSGVGAKSLEISEADNGHSIRVPRGTQIQVVLHNTYWQLRGTSDSATLAPAGEPQFKANRSECLPGAGCGTVTQSFTAIGAGRAEINAERTVCGEALPCTPDQRRFSVTVIVGN